MKFCGWINWKAVHVAVWEGVRLPPRWFGVDPPCRTTASGWKLTSRACVSDPVSTHLHSWVWAAPHPMSEFSKWSRLCEKNKKIKSLVSLFRHPSGPVCHQGGPLPQTSDSAPGRTKKKPSNLCDSGSLLEKGAHVRGTNRAMSTVPVIAVGSRTHSYILTTCVWERIFPCFHVVWYFFASDSGFSRRQDRSCCPTATVFP